MVDARNEHENTKGTPMKTMLQHAVAVIVLAAAPLAAQDVGSPPAPAQGAFGATPQTPQQAPGAPTAGAGLPTGEVVSNEPQVGETYLRGRQRWEARTAASTAQAVELFLRAIELDPNFASARSGFSCSARRTACSALGNISVPGRPPYGTWCL